ncbi:patatin-like phospholipase family protein [Pseudorhodoplanes sinuspersici]|nr:patatin-like phospholipase family protein [Pseudorhodoplanes sinuspersici]RKE73329.1 patatin-like phospholipase [Pseudorhodoplanes sinuspersici]
MNPNAKNRIRFAGAIALALFFLSSGIIEAARLPAAADHSVSVSSQSKKKKAAKKKARPAKSAKPEGLPARIPFTATDQDAAAIPNIPDARFWADSEKEYLRALPQARGPWLILSTGGSDGAFGAGLLNGWTKAGTRPEFTLVTGTSTGALIAPFAFLGPKYDDALHDAYTTIGAIDIFEVGGKGESFLDTWPLRDLIAKRVTPDLIQAIAAEHARGRKLFITTTNLDAGRPVVWDIGAIAADGGDRAVALVRKVMLASISIPGAFPPVLIDVEANGRKFQEMHVDGGLGAQFYVAPDSMLVSTSTASLRASDIYVIANMKLGSDFEITERNTLGILGRTVATAIRIVIRNAIDRVYETAKRNNIGFYLAFVDQSFSAPARGPFDTDYMKTLYEAGFAKGSGPDPFLREPPDFSDQPRKAAR